MPRVRALMVCVGLSQDADENTIATFDAAAAGANVPENRAFAEATPTARLSMMISRGRPAAKSLEQGGLYYVDIELANDVRGREGTLPEGQSLGETRDAADASREQP